MPLLMLNGSMEDGDNSDFSVAFVTNDLVDLSEYRTVKFAFTANGETSYLGYYLSNMQGKMPSSEINLGGHNGKVFLGVRLTEIENKYKTSSGGNVQMWLSKASALFNWAEDKAAHYQDAATAELAKSQLKEFGD